MEQTVNVFSGFAVQDLYFLGEAAVRDLEASSVVTRRVRTISLPLDDLG